jgi:hypothetical protein
VTWSQFLGTAHSAFVMGQKRAMLVLCTHCVTEMTAQMGSLSLKERRENGARGMGKTEHICAMPSVSYVLTAAHALVVW